MDDALLSEAAQNVLRQGYLPRIIRSAIERIHEKNGLGHEITDERLLDEIEDLRRESDLPHESLKKPVYADNQQNEAVPQDPKGIQRENEEMRRLLVCKSCNLTDVTHVITKCGHMLCEACTRMINRCIHCGDVITKLQIVKFGNNL